MEWTSCLRRQIACMCIDEIEWIDEIECIEEIERIEEIEWIALPFSYVLYNNVYLLMIC